VVWLSCFSYSNAQSNIDGNPTALNLGDDSWSAVQLGFDISYFGQTFDQITIYNNGMAKFGNNGQYVQNCCQGYKPTSDQHDYGLFPLWTDLVTINNNTPTGLQGVYYLSDNVDTFQISWVGIQEFHNQETSNTFGIEIKSTFDGALVDFFYDEIDIRNHDVWSGITGDVSEGEVIENFFHTHQDGMLTGASEFDFSWNQSGYINCSNPLNDPSCSGYEEAYFEQQCSTDPLYDQQCPGYERAYTDQQCSYDPLYDPSCPGYEQAYEDQQCSADPLWSPKCPGFQIAFEEEQCRADSQWSSTCPGFKFETFSFESSNSFYFEDFSLGDTGEEYDAFGNVKIEENEIYSESTDEYFYFEEYNEFEPQFDRVFEEELIFEESFTTEPELDEFIPEDIREAIEELQTLAEEQEERQELEEIFEEFTEESNEEIEEDVVVITETAPEEVSDQGGTAPARRSGSRIGLSVGLGTASNLVAGLISNSIESGQSAAAQGFGSGGYFDSGQGSISAISGQSVTLQEMMNTTTGSEDTQSGGVETGIPSISLDLNVTMNNFQIEIKEPSLAERMADKVRKSNLDNQAGIFNKQITMIENIAAGNNLNKYYEERVADASSWYNQKVIYAGALKDRDDSFYRLNSESYGLMRDMIRSQY
jgi:hypothetical protein